MSTEELWDIPTVAAHLGVKLSSARSQLTRWQLRATSYRMGPGGRPIALYDAAEVREAAAKRPGRGSRTDLHNQETNMTITAGSRIVIPAHSVPEDWPTTGEAVEVGAETIVVELDNGRRQELPADEVTRA